MIESKPTGVVGALIALDDLKEAMKTIQIPSPMYMPGESKATAYKACEQVLEAVEWHLKQLTVFLDGLEV